MPPSTYEQLLHEEVAQYYDDPLGFVLAMFDWPLNGEDGPDTWQADVLRELGEEVRARGFTGIGNVLPIRESVSSGHSIGKSALIAWIVCWAMSTRPRCRGTVSANTNYQLEFKTWAAVREWVARCRTAHWFEINSRVMYRKGNDPETGQPFRSTWNCAPQSCAEENSESFAGQHAKGSMSFYIFDEACHDALTEVMTAAGWRLFRDITPSTPLLTPNGWELPVALHASHRNGGPMKLIEKRGLSMKVTPNHDLWLQSPKTKRYRRKQAQAVRTCQERALRIVEWSADDAAVSDDQLTLDAWYYSEGHLLEGGYGFGITNHTDHGITDLLTRMGLRFSKNRHQWLVWDRVLAARYAEQGRGCLVKTIPVWMFQLSQRQMRVFLDTYAIGDGYIKANKRIIYTSSPRMADDLHALACLAGFNSSKTVREITGQRKWIKDHWAISSGPGYVVSLSETGAGVEISSANIRDVDYDGMVYCATVPSGLLFTRRNGTVIWSGNSAIPDGIWEVAEGGLTDEPLIVVVGNPTRNTGKFYESVFGKQRDRWKHHVIDARTCKFANHKLIEEWEQDYGEDSDFFRVRVKGLPPNASEAQFIDNVRVWAAQKNHVSRINPKEPLIAGVDVSGGGKAWTVCRFRRGLDARSVPPIRISGENTVKDDRQLVVSKLAEALSRKGSERVEAMFIDSAFGSPVVVELRNRGFRNVYEINFGAPSPDDHQLNQRAYQWNLMKEWLPRGCIPGDDIRLEADLVGPGFKLNKKNQLVLESKESMQARGVPSPDDGDGLSLTFASPVAPIDEREQDVDERVTTTWG